MDYNEVTDCRCCGSNDLTQYLDLTDQPPANSYHDLGEVIQEYPLKALICANCYHSTLSIVINPDLLYRDYAYVSGTSKTLRDYFDWFAKITEAIIKQVNPQAKDLKVMDIACNDGSQLDSFLELGWNTYGVDPARNLWPITQMKGHKVICDYWTPTIAQKINRKYDALVAQNVFAHTDDIMSFLLACKEGMHEKSVLFIQTSQSEIFVNNEFDTMYHEHLSFFTVNSMKAVCERAGVSLREVFKTKIHGTSYVFVIMLDDTGLPDSNIENAISAEKALGLYNLATYTDFAKNAQRIVKDLKEKVDELKGMGYVTIGLGAAAKGMTVLNMGQIQLDTIIDENELKIGKYTPGQNIHIQDFEMLDRDTCFPNSSAQNSKIAFVPLAWNFYDELREKIKLRRNNENDVFVKYFPKLEILK